MADETISALNASTVAAAQATLVFEGQNVGGSAPESRKYTWAQLQQLALDLAVPAAVLASALGAGVLFPVYDPGLGNPETNARSMTLAEFQKAVLTKARVLQVNGRAKAGTTAGWVVAAADNLGKIATLPAAQAGSTLVLAVGGLRVGDIITGFALEGSLQSGGNHATIIADLRVLTAAVAGATDASVGVMAAALDVTANTIASSANAAKSGLAHTVVEGESFYLLITATTAAACTEELQAVHLYVTGL